MPSLLDTLHRFCSKEKFVSSYTLCLPIEGGTSVNLLTRLISIAFCACVGYLLGKFELVFLNCFLKYFSCVLMYLLNFGNCSSRRRNISCNFVARRIRMLNFSVVVIFSRLDSAWNRTNWVIERRIEALELFVFIVLLANHRQSRIAQFSFILPLSSQLAAGRRMNY